MTQKQKDLLLEDLCARLPYDVKVNCNDKVYNFAGIQYFNICILTDDNENNAFTTAGLKYIKPYLLPLSNMSEEQKEEIEDKLIFPSNSNGGWIEILCNGKYEIPFWFVDFCNKNHFDYRGLIPMGLANDATGLNIY